MKKGTHIRVEKDVLENIRRAFPNSKSDNDRIASLFDNQQRIDNTINGLGKILYGGKIWKKLRK